MDDVIGIVGLSRRKVDTLRDVAEQPSDGRLDDDTLAALPDDAFISALTATFGIDTGPDVNFPLIGLRRLCERRRFRRPGNDSAVPSV